VTVAQIEPSWQPARPAAQDAPVARPAAAAQARPTAPVVVPAVRQPAHAAPAAGKRTDGRHWSQADSQRMKADAVRAQADAMPGQVVLANRPSSAIRQVEYRRGY
jgi:hypothetical protein